MNEQQCAHCGVECAGIWQDNAGEIICSNCAATVVEGKFEQLGAVIGNAVDQKQAAYGNSFGKVGQILQILYPSGVSLDQYDDLLVVIRIIDKLFRIANQKDAFGENPYRDIAGYGLLGARR